MIYIDNNPDNPSSILNMFSHCTLHRTGMYTAYLLHSMYVLPSVQISESTPTEGSVVNKRITEDTIEQNVQKSWSGKLFSVAILGF